MSKYYGLVTSNAELKELQKNAALEGKIAVGFTKKGNAYRWDDELKKAVLVESEQLKEILEVDEETLAKIISSKGKYELPQVIEATEPLTYLECQEEAVQEKEEDEDEEYCEDVYISDQLNELIELKKTENNKLNRIIELLEASILE